MVPKIRFESRQSLIEHNGRLMETKEEMEAWDRVRGWWKTDCGWGGAVEMAEPVKGDQPGIFKVQTAVTPSASRMRARPHSTYYGLNAAGRKSHHKPKVEAE